MPGGLSWAALDALARQRRERLDRGGESVRRDRGSRDSSRLEVRRRGCRDLGRLRFRREAETGLRGSRLPPGPLIILWRNGLHREREARAPEVGRARKLGVARQARVLLDTSGLAAGGGWPVLDALETAGPGRSRSGGSG